MSNPFFNASGAPANRSAGASATIRAEFAAIAAGFELLSMGLNSIPIGATTPASGAFTTLSASGATTLTSLTMAGAIGGITDLTTTGNTVLGNATTDTLNVGANGLVKDASGNIGLGVAPSVRLHVKSAVAENSRLETTVARGSGALYTSWYDPTGRKGYFGFGGSDDTLYFYNELNELIVFGTNNTERLGITGDGRLYGRNLHNNAGAVTGTTKQYVASGTYTPTITNGANVASSTPRACMWIRVGNVVHVAGSVTVTTTAAAATTTSLRVSLPIASTISGRAEGSGMHAADSLGASNASEVGYMIPFTNDMEMQWSSANNSNHNHTFHFTYLMA